MIYTLFFLLTALHPSHSLFTDDRVFIVRICCDSIDNREDCDDGFNNVDCDIRALFDDVSRESDRELVVM